MVAQVKTEGGFALKDASSTIRKLLIKTFNSDGPSLWDLAENVSICREWLKRAVHGHWHASGTCRMGRSGDLTAVTGPSGLAYSAGFESLTRLSCQQSRALIRILQP